MNNMTVLQICYKYPPHHSGYGRQLATINAELVRSSRVNITVLAGLSEATSSKDGIQIIPAFTSVCRSPILQKLQYFFFCFVFIPMQFYRFYKTDCVHIVKAGHEVCVPSILCALFNKPFIVKIAQDDVQRKNTTLLKKISLYIRSKCIRKASYVISLSDRITSDLKEIQIKAERILPIPNGVDTQRFKQETLFSKRSATPASDVIGSMSDFGIFVGTLNRRKGVQDLLDALVILSQDFDFEFVFLGALNADEIKFSEYKEALISNGCTIHHIDPINTPEDIISRAKFLVLPSYSEGMPNVVLESMSLNIPVLLSNIPVHQELVNFKIGETHILGDVADLKEKLHSFFSAAKLNYSCRKVCVENFAVDIVAQRYYSLYSRLAK